MSLADAASAAITAGSSDGQLVEACRRGDRLAMRTFYETYRRRVFALIARICGRQEAEELSQEVFLRAFRGLENFRGDAQLSTWMYRLAVKRRAIPCVAPSSARTAPRLGRRARRAPRRAHSRG